MYHNIPGYPQELQRILSKLATVAETVVFAVAVGGPADVVVVVVAGVGGCGGRGVTVCGVIVVVVAVRACCCCLWGLKAVF